MIEPEPRRFFIGVATTGHAYFADIDRPELQRALDTTAKVFVRDFRYELVPGFGVNSTREQLKDSFDAFFASPDRRDSDIAVVYYTGHAEVADDGEYVLLLHQTSPRAVKRTGLKGSELASWIFDDTPVKRVLLILDTCESGAGAVEISRKAAAAIDLTPIVDRHPEVSIISATRPQEYATSCAFTDALVRALRGMQVARYGPRHLSLDALVEVINDSAETPEWQTARHFRISERESQFFPNLRHDATLDGLDLLTQLLVRDSPARTQDMRTHFLLRAKGIDIPGDHWLFTGRHRMLEDLCDWLRGEGEFRSRIVTGGPGSGKSAVLGRLAVLSLPDFRARVPDLENVPPETLPPEGSMAMPIYARGMTPEQLLDAVCAAVRVPPSSVEELARRLQGESETRAVVIDAIDEAADPPAVVDQVLVPLVRVAAAVRLRILLGMRPHLVGRFEHQTFVLLDAEEPAYVDPASMITYSRRCLVELSPDSPYRDKPEVASRVARWIAAAAGHSFLVALINSRSLAGRRTVIARLNQIEMPDDAAVAMQSDLEHRLGRSARKARRLMAPLAFAQGDGLPWENLWAPLASEITGVDTTDEDVGWVMKAAGGYIVETRVGDRSTYRLYHEALAEDLRRSYDDVASHRAMVRVLHLRVPRNGRGEVDWTAAGHYTLYYLALHAARGGVLESLLLDPAYLLAAERTNLLTALSAVTGAEARATAAAYREAAHRFALLAGAQALSYLELAAHKQGARQLCAAIARLRVERWWTVEWARWQPQTPHRNLGRASGPVTTMAIGRLNNRPIVVTTSSDRRINIWDFATGNRVVDRKLASDRPPAKIATLAWGPRTFVASGTMSRVDGQVTVYEFPSGAMVSQFSSEDMDPSSGVGLVRTAGSPTVLAPRSTGALWSWDPRTGDSADQPPIRQYIDDHFSSLGHLDERPIAITRSETNVVRVHDIEQKSLLAEIQVFRDTPKRNCGVSRVGGTLYFVAYSSSAIEVWDTEAENRVFSFGFANPALTTADDLEEGEEDLEPMPALSGSGRPRRSSHPAPAAGRWGVPNRSMVSAVIVDRDGAPVLAVAYDNGQIVCRPLAPGARAEPALQGHRGGILYMLPLEFDGRPMLVTAGQDWTIRVWDVLPGNAGPIRWEAEELDVQCLTGATYDGDAVTVVSTADARIRIWNRRGVEVLSQTVVSQVWDLFAVSVDGHPTIYGPGLDRSLRGWRLAGEATQVADLWSGRADWISAVAAHELPGGTQAFVAVESGGVYAVDVRTEEITWLGDIGRLDNPVISLCASRNGNSTVLGVVQRDGAASVWDLPGRRLKLVCRLDVDEVPLWILIDARNRWAVASIGRTLLRLRIPDGFTGRVRSRLRGLDVLGAIALDTAVTAACYDEDLQLIFVGQGGSMRIYNRSFGLVRVIDVGAGVRKLVSLGKGRIVAATDAGSVGLALMRQPFSDAVIDGVLVEPAPGSGCGLVNSP